MAHWALSLGLSEVVAARLGEGARGLSAEQVRGLVFRITRKKGIPGAHQQLFAASSLERLHQRWDQLQKGPLPIAIALQGGIGDHLQDLSALMSLLRVDRQGLRVHLAPERMAQLRGVLETTKEHLLFSDQPLLASNGLHVLELMAVLGSETLLPQSWIQPTQPPRLPYRLLCCWTALGQGDRFSSWTRSLPFAAVQELYQTLMGIGWEPHAIVDISAWKPWEAAALRQLGVQLVDPAAGDVLDLAQQVTLCSQVVSIDSALVHLCAAMGRAVHLVLPKYHDERWVELLQPGSSYARCCQVWRQERFGCWQGPLQRLIAAIRLP